MKTKIKIYGILGILISLSIFSTSIVYASENTKSNVNISIVSEKNEYSPTINCEVEVNFSDKELYNNEQLLSYHIYDNSNNVLNGECERIPLILNDKIKFKVDLSKYIDLNSNNEVYIKFDIVDQKNNYWMSTNNNIDLKTEAIKYEKNEFKRIINMYETQFLENKIVVLINIIPWLLGIIFLVKRRNKSEK